MPIGLSASVFIYLQSRTSRSVFDSTARASNQAPAAFLQGELIQFFSETPVGFRAELSARNFERNNMEILQAVPPGAGSTGDSELCGTSGSGKHPVYDW